MAKFETNPVVVKRIYDPVDSTDGYRVLVDRLWPRGVSRDRTKLDEWVKVVTPSDALRRWYGHEPERWEEFQIRYRLELGLREPTKELVRLSEIAREQGLSLLTAARSRTQNHVLVLQDLILSRLE